jgi:hypothetical protein
MKHHLAYRLRQYADWCDAAPARAGMVAFAVAAVIVAVDVAPKARIARWVARRIER